MLLLLLLRNLFGGSSKQKTRIEFFVREIKSDQPQALAQYARIISARSADTIYRVAKGVVCEADPYDCLQNENENEFVFVFAI